MNITYKATLVLIATVSIAGCASYKTTLANSKGETMTCESSGKNGLITGYLVRKRFDDCVDDARSKGFGARTAENIYKPSPNQPEILVAPTHPQSTTQSTGTNNEASTTHKPVVSVVSKYDYQAREVARAKNCRPKTNPSILGVGQAQEIFGFQCDDGRELVIKCDSVSGCTS